MKALGELLVEATLLRGDGVVIMEIGTPWVDAVHARIITDPAAPGGSVTLGKNSFYYPACGSVEQALIYALEGAIKEARKKP